MMHRNVAIGVVGVLSGLGLLGAACVGIGGTGSEPNPYLTLTENVLGVSVGSNQNNNGGSGGGGGVTADVFRAEQTLTLANLDTVADLNVSMAAWINVSSLRSAEQQDALLNGGYVQLTRETRIGLITLPPGTFVFNGPGVAGTTAFEVSAQDEESVTLITPDRILLYTAPPSSCDDVAFYFTINDEVIRDPGTGFFDGNTRGLGLKTLAQIDAYSCNPLNPGLFLQTGGGTKDPNEYFEGEAIRVEFRLNVVGSEDPAAAVMITGDA